MTTPGVRRALRWPRSTIASGTGDAVMIVTTHVHHVCTMSHGTHMVHTWCAPCGAHMVCTMCCTPCVHHVHTHGVPSGLIPWYLGPCPKQFLYEIFRCPLTWPRYRSKVRTRLNPYSFLVLKKTWWYSVERVSMSRPKKDSFWLLTLKSPKMNISEDSLTASRLNVSVKVSVKFLTFAWGGL